MREILFRGKRTDNGEWTKGTPFFAANCCKMIHAVAVHPDFADEGNVYYSEGYPVDPETVGQFTGLTDKNGVKIFEGDIVEAEVTVNLGSSVRRSTARYVVMYHPENCYFYLARKRNNILFDGNWNYSVDIIGAVGNIHDNPELLEVGGDG